MRCPISHKNLPSKQLTSHLGKRKIIFKSALGGDILVPRRVINNMQTNSKSDKILGFSFQKKYECNSVEDMITTFPDFFKVTYVESISGLQKVDHNIVPGAVGL